MSTKAQLIAEFEHYFDDYTAEDRARIFSTRYFHKVNATPKDIVCPTQFCTFEGIKRQIQEWDSSKTTHTLIHTEKISREGVTSFRLNHRTVYLEEEEEGKS